MSYHKHASAILAACAVLVSGCSDSGGGNGSTAVTPASSGGGASSGAVRIAFPAETHDLGVVTDTTTHRLRFPFTNAGQSQLIVSDIKGDCGCTVPTISRRVFGPGDGDAIEVVFDPKGKKGPETRTITVLSNADREAVKLTFTADIRPMIDFDSMTQLGTMPVNDGSTHRLEMKYTDPDLTIKRVRTNNPSIGAAVVETGTPAGQLHGRPARQATIELTVSPEAPWGVLFANKLYIDLEGRPMPDATPIDHTYEMSLLGKIIGELDAQPMILSLGGLTPNGAYAKSTTITRSTGEPFTVIDAVVVESTMPGIEVEVEPVGPAATRVTVSGNVGGFRGWVRGRLAVQTNVPGEELLQIPISGLVK